MTILDDTFGALFIGLEFSLVAYGFVLLQCWIFLQQWRSERLILKLTVASTLFFGFIHIFFISHGVYYYLVSSIGNSGALTNIVWSFKAETWVTEPIVAVTCLFYLFRIFHIYRSFVLVGIILLLIISHVALNFASASLEMLAADLAPPKVTARLAQAGLSIGLVLDLFIMFSMLRFFYVNRSNFKSTQNLLDKLALYTVASGMITVVASIITLATLIALPTKQIYAGTGFLIPHLYSNSLLAVLNSRRHLRKSRVVEISAVSFGSNSNSLPMSTITQPTKKAAPRPGDGTYVGDSEVYSIQNIKEEGEISLEDGFHLRSNEMGSIGELVRNDRVF